MKVARTLAVKEGEEAEEGDKRDVLGALSKLHQLLKHQGSEEDAAHSEERRMFLEVLPPAVQLKREAKIAMSEGAAALAQKAGKDIVKAVVHMQSLITRLKEQTGQDRTFFAMQRKLGGGR